MKTITTKDAAILLLLALEKYKYPKNYLDQLLDHLEIQLLEPSKEIGEKQVFAVINDLKKQKPVEYITGVATFYNNNFMITSDVLIPRPDTEILIENALEILHSLNEPTTVIDIGTGSGAIIISLYEMLAEKEMDFWAVDISEKALSVAKQNASQLLGNNTIKWHHIDVIPAEIPTTKNIVIVTNPPYISKEEMTNLPDSVKNYEPHLALEEQMEFIPKLQVYIDKLQTEKKIVHIAIEYNKAGKMIQRYSTPLQVSLQELLEE